MDGRRDGNGPALSLARHRLDPRRPYKPLDVGNGIVAGSLTAGGRWLELGIAHRVHGRVVVTDAPAFDPERRFDQPAVRRYRAALADPERPGFGLAALAGPATAALLEASFPVAIHDRGGARVEVVTFAPPGRHGAVQIVRAVMAGGGLDLGWTGTLRLGRAAYTQLTRGGPLPEVEERPLRGADGRTVWVVDETLGAAVAIAPPDPSAHTGTHVTAIALADRLADAIREANDLVRHGERLLEETVEARRTLWSGADLGPAQNVARRAVAYALDCAASEAGEGSTAVLADHVILPLVWTRDAYYVCRALLALAPREGAALAARSLRWCFESAERPEGWWPRASLATGGAKDHTFQLDQQLYPLLLLEDHARHSGDDTLLRRYAADRDRVLDALLARRTTYGLIATAETPADDPIDAPYHFSSHVLLWRALRDVAPHTAEEVRRATLAHFVIRGRFAYAVGGPDGQGAHHYHDANDLPTVFAPGWGFCASDDPVWRATIEFAWSSGHAGYFAGRYAGLGSVHTPHPWPLGDLQELVVARVQGDRARAADAGARLRRVAMWDEMLPEAYEERTGAVASRHWFAWPLLLWAFLDRDPTVIAP
ncbi:MAG TPA: glycoside hydrolase family 125 protein [Candidatus Limnocylindria bacterium]|nr:glycoside hydrolase family 125 protein [Candidatus Limnocylindria bacterium]